MKNFGKIIEESVYDSMKKHGLIESKTAKTTVKPNTVSKKLVESVVAMPKAFLLKTEKLSSKTKEMLEITYKNLVNQYNSTSPRLDATNKQESNSIQSDYRNLYKSLVYSCNAIKLYELYFANISDVNSQISTDSLPYMRLARDFGTFDQWQSDFIAACLASRSGWAIVAYDCCSNEYYNGFIDGHDQSVPVAGIPVLVLNLNDIAFVKDYGTDVYSYIVSMMREINWSVVEARMSIVEKSNLKQIWDIIPSSNLPQKSDELKRVASQSQINPVPVVPPQDNANIINSNRQSIK